MIDVKFVVNEATDKANAITNSVVKLARVLKVTPKALSDALLDEEAHADYFADFVSEYVKGSVAKAKEEDKKDCE